MTCEPVRHSPRGALFILVQVAALSLLTSHIPRTVKLGPESSADGSSGHGRKEHHAKDMWWADFVNMLQEENN